MNENIIIRKFEGKDREEVRRICCDTADRGEAIEQFFPDREFAADLLTCYYTDYEPESAFVAESSSGVVGYVQGCCNNRRYGLVMAWILIPQAVVKGFKRGVFFRAELWQIVRAMLCNWRRLFVWRKTSFDSHQGHIHIGIAKECRGRQVGKQLVEAFLKYAQTQGLNEITASVHEGNSAACQFFSRLGFVVRERYPMIMAQGNKLECYHSLLYVKKIN